MATEMTRLMSCGSIQVKTTFMRAASLDLIHVVVDVDIVINPYVWNFSIIHITISTKG